MQTEAVQSDEKAEKSKKEKKEFTPDEQYQRLSKIKERDATRLSKADKTFMEEYEAEKESIRKLESLRHRLVSAADMHGRKQIQAIRKEITDAVGAFAKEESARLKAIKQKFDGQKVMSKRAFDNAIKQANESFNADKKRIQREWEAEIEAVREDYADRYKGAETVIHDRCDSVSSAVAAFVEAVKNMDDAQLEELMDATEVKITDKDGKESVIQIPAKK